jgi:hypothetical protein
VNIEQFEALVRSSIARAKELGWTIVMRDWGSTVTKCCCPISSINVCKYGVQFAGEYEAAYDLGMDRDSIYEFIHGFDNRGEDPGNKDPYYLLGARIANEVWP